jgi:hypothetical protein
MKPTVDDDGCAAFDAEVNFDDSAIGTVLRSGVKLDGPLGEDLWGRAIVHAAAGSVDRDLLPDAPRPLRRPAAAGRVRLSLFALGAERKIDRSRPGRSGAWLCRR